MKRDEPSPETISENNVVASALLQSQRDLIEKLVIRKQDLTEQVQKLHAHLLCLTDNEEIHSVLLETNRTLEETVAEIGRQLQQGRERLEQATKKMRSLLCVTRMFLEFGDENRATFLAFLERDYAMKVDSRVFKQQLTHLIDMLPSEGIHDLQSTMENMLIDH